MKKVFLTSLLAIFLGTSCVGLHVGVGMGIGLGLGNISISASGRARKPHKAPKAQNRPNNNPRHDSRQHYASPIHDRGDRH